MSCRGVPGLALASVAMFLSGCCHPGASSTPAFDWRGPVVGCQLTPHFLHDPNVPDRNGTHFYRSDDDTWETYILHVNETKVLRYQSSGYCGAKAANVSVEPVEVNDLVDIQIRPTEFRIEPGQVVYMEITVTPRGPVQEYRAGPKAAETSEVVMYVHPVRVSTW